MYSDPHSGFLWPANASRCGTPRSKAGTTYALAILIFCLHNVNSVLGRNFVTTEQIDKCPMRSLSKKLSIHLHNFCLQLLKWHLFQRDAKPFLPRTRYLNLLAPLPRSTIAARAGEKREQLCLTLASLPGKCTSASLAHPTERIDAVGMCASLGKVSETIEEIPRKVPHREQILSEARDQVLDREQMVRQAWQQMSQREQMLRDLVTNLIIFNLSI